MSVLTRRHFLKQAGMVSLSFLFGPSVWAKGKDFPIRCGIDMGLQHLFVIPQVIKMMEAKGYTNMQWKKLALRSSSNPLLLRPWILWVNRHQELALSISETKI